MGSLTWAAMMAVVVVASDVQESVPDDRLYGRVSTTDGAVYEGYLRWDRNEGSWADVLNGDKDMPRENLRQAEDLDEEYGRRRDRERSIEILGFRISWDEDEDDYPESAASGIRFGHIRTLEVVDRNRARLLLKSGQELELHGGSTDIGSDLRELVVDDPERGETSLEWRDLERVDFMPAPEGRMRPRAQRLYGTLHTRDGQEYTGFVAWDVDEILASDVLDGEERGRDRSIPFSSIRSIERSGSSGSRVVLSNGEEVILRDSNDVDDSNRGIGISDSGIGQVTVDWDDFDRIDFHAAPTGEGLYDAFDGGVALWGTVVDEGGQRVTGWVRWDNDEEYTWELLDGRQGHVDFDVEFGRIASISRAGSWGSVVRLLDGRVLELEGSNDVDSSNKGIFVTPDGGSTVLVRWDDFRQVTFQHR